MADKEKAEGTESPGESPEETATGSPDESRVDVVDDLEADDELSFDIEFDDDELLETAEVETIRVTTSELLAVDDDSLDAEVVSHKPPPPLPVEKSAEPAAAPPPPESEPASEPAPSSAKRPLVQIPGVELLGVGTTSPGTMALGPQRQPAGLSAAAAALGEPPPSKRRSAQVEVEAVDAKAADLAPDVETLESPDAAMITSSPKEDDAAGGSEAEPAPPESDESRFRPELLAPPPDPVELAGEVPVTDTAPTFKPFSASAETQETWAEARTDIGRPTLEEGGESKEPKRFRQTEKGLPSVPQLPKTDSEVSSFRVPGKIESTSDESWLAPGRPETETGRVVSSSPPRQAEVEVESEPATSTMTDFPSMQIEPPPRIDEGRDRIALGLMETTPVSEIVTHSQAEAVVDAAATERPESLFPPDIEAESAHLLPSVAPGEEISLEIDLFASAPELDERPDDLFPPVPTRDQPGDTTPDVPDLSAAPSWPPMVIPVDLEPADATEPTIPALDLQPIPPSMDFGDAPLVGEMAATLEKRASDESVSEADGVLDFVPEATKQLRVGQSAPVLPLPPPLSQPDESSFGEITPLAEGVWSTESPSEFGHAAPIELGGSGELHLPLVEPLPIDSVEFGSAEAEAQLPEVYLKPEYKLPSEATYEDDPDDMAHLGGIRITAGPSTRPATTRFETAGRRLSEPEVRDQKEESIAEPLRAYLLELHKLQPGPGGIGPIERRACAVEIDRPADVALTASASEFGGAKDPGAINVVVPSISLNEALISAISTWTDRPVVVVGSAGSGKSHALNNLAAAFATRILGDAGPPSAMADMLLPLDGPDGFPHPIRFDLASVAGLKPTDGESLLRALVQQRHIPEELSTFAGPAVVIADGLNAAVEWDGADIDPMSLLCDLLERRPKWRAVAACQPLPGEVFLDWGERFGPFPVVEIADMDAVQARVMSTAWSTVARPHPAEPKRLAQLLPAEISSSPRLLQMLLGQWLTAAVSIEAMVRLAGAGGVGRLILDGVCKRTEVESGAVHTRQDLQILADVANGLNRNSVPLADVQMLTSEGFLRDSLESLESTGVIEIRLIRGDRPDGSLAFTHPIFQEILLAEYLENELISLGLKREYDGLLAELQPVEQLAPYSARQVRRLLEVSNILLDDLSVHLRPDLLESIGTWLWYQLKRGDFPDNAHYPRLLGVSWILIATINRLGGGPHVQAFARLKEQCSPILLDLLAKSGEEALRQIIYRL